MEAFINCCSIKILAALPDVSNRKKFTSRKTVSPKNVKQILTMASEKEVNLLFKSSVVLSSLLFPFLAYAIPDAKPQTSVFDESGVLTKSSVSYLEKTLQKLKETNGTEVYFVSVRSLPYGTEPEQYAGEIFQKWNLGEKDVVVVLANKIAKAGVFFGQGITSLTSEMSRSIGEETYPFKAKEEQYSSAALDVSNRLVSILSNKGDPGAPTLVRENSSSNFKSAKVTEQQRSKYVAIIAILLVVAFVVPMVQFFYYVKDE
mmetsp:Transcript_61269/g.126564  ORF Transcript_61269/g.126564 Transcript_61269/m.126564 type:complete len:260 (-) Transcript_61269:690-1469(-)